MIKKTVACPRCKSQIVIEGEPGQITILNCPSCKLKGRYTFSSDKPQFKKISDSYAIQINNITKIFKKFKAVDDVSFNVKTGEIYGFLGPNGAGKTTTIKAMLGLIHVNNGDIKINGFDIKKDPVKIKEKRWMISGLIRI